MTKKPAHDWGDATRAIHSGESKHGVGVPVSMPIARTSTFTFSSTAEMKRWAEGKSKAYIYTRYGNPTLAVAEARLAELERGEAAVVTASGMAAISSALLAVRKAVELARRHNLLSLIDNTFASPILQKPLAMGFDLALHSATKYLSGHSDLIAGAAVGSRKLIDQVRQMVIYLGGSMDPDAAFLLMRGLKTLDVRVRRQCATAMTVAKFLARHPKVARVHYPGLPSHPDHRLAKRQMTGFGSMLAFDLRGGLPAGRRFCDRVRVFLLAASLGGVESLVVLPIYTSHYRMSRQELAGAGVAPGTVRVSVGLEDPADLIADLKQALA